MTERNHDNKPISIWDEQQTEHIKTDFSFNHKVQ